MSDIAVAILVSFLGSTGLWAFLSKWLDNRSAKSKLIVGLAHDRIVHLGMQYIDRGWITRDEYENLHDYLYVPYEKMGGNGSAKRVMMEVDKLPIHSTAVE